MLVNIFKTILVTSFAGTVLTVFLMLLKPITQKYFSRNWHYYIWLVVLVLMILPIKIVIPQKFVYKEPAKLISQTTKEFSPKDVKPSLGAEEQETKYIPEQKNDLHIAQSKIKSFAERKINVFSLIWFLGMIIIFLQKLAAYFIFLLKLHRYSNIISCPELMRFTDKKIIVRTGGKISSPLLTGLFKPTLLLPQTTMTHEQLNNVLAHEVTHFKRKDILYKWFLSIVKCIHWFNPAVYYIGKQVNTECEISCDLAVVKQMSKEQELCYIDTIITLLSAGGLKAAAQTTKMSGDKKTLKKRFNLIKNKVAVSKKAKLISAIFALVMVFAAVLTNGLLSERLTNKYKNELLQVNTDPKKGEDFNFLILGVDEQNRADTIMVLSFENGTVTCSSIPRDTAFAAEVSGENIKLNDILKNENGDQRVIDAVKNTMQIPINYYAKIRLSAVEKIIDSVGGIEFDVPMDMKYDDPHKNLHINLKKGRRCLNGNEVCGLLRFKRGNDGLGYTDGDLTRITVGHQVITEFINQKFDKKFIKTFPDIFAVLADGIETNYPISNLLGDIKSLDNTKSIITFNIISGTAKTYDNQITFYDINDGEILSAKSYPDLTPSPKEIKNHSTETENKKSSVHNSESKKISKSSEATNPNETKIKSTLESKEPYDGFEHLVLKNADTEKIKQELNKQGMTETKSSSVDLTKNYAVKDYTCGQTNVKADKNGNISLYLSVNGDNLFDVNFYDETGKNTGSYTVLANNENAYTFTGFERDKTYISELAAKTKDSWTVEGNYIIY